MGREGLSCSVGQQTDWHHHLQGFAFLATALKPLIRALHLLQEGIDFLEGAGTGLSKALPQLAYRGLWQA
jgi:hypothetical protein